MKIVYAVGWLVSAGLGAMLKFIAPEKAPLAIFPLVVFLILLCMEIWRGK